MRLQEMRSSSALGPTYVLMTAAHNEEAFIERTMMSVCSQTRLPQRWVIVSDNSNDRTDEIVETYVRKYNFIRFLRVTRTPGRTFASKVIALQRAEKLLTDIAFDFIGNLDADITVSPSYFEQLIDHCEQNPRLGIVSGFIWEEWAGEFQSRTANRVDSVPHAAQLVRRKCYEEIGGYTALKNGGEDWYAQTCAKIKGWRVESVPSLHVFHHRHTGASTSLLSDRFRLGKLDYSLGSAPLFELLKCIQRLPETPFFMGGVARFAGFIWSYLCAEERPVPEEFIAFLRSEQKLRVRSLFRKGHPTNTQVVRSDSSAPGSMPSGEQRDQAV